jgi:hypothetical protein
MPNESKLLSKVRMIQHQVKEAKRTELRSKVVALKEAETNFTNLEIAATLNISENLVRQLLAEHKSLSFISETSPLERELASVLNKYSAENESNTPDFILAEYLMACLNAFNTASNSRQAFHGEGTILNEK